MKSCCENNCAVEALRERQRSTLITVLWINAVMFAVMVAASFYGRSTALLSDSLDNLGDALTYALSLYAVSRSGVTKARVALFKGGLIFLAASLVVAQIIQRLRVLCCRRMRSWDSSVWRACWPMAPACSCSGVTGTMTSTCLWISFRCKKRSFLTQIGANRQLGTASG